MRELLELRFMDRGLASLVSASMFDDAYTCMLERTQRLRDGTPIFTRGVRPAEFWFDYGLHLAKTHRGSTLRDYSHSAAMFARFIDGQSKSISGVSEADIVEYRERRTSVDAVAPATWGKDATVIQGIFDYAIEKRYRDSYPWFQHGKRSSLRQPYRPAPDTRGLSDEEWIQFKQLGLLGRDLAGGVNPAFRTVWVMRNLAGAELAISTGLRVQEFSTLLLPEVLTPRNSEGGVSLTVQATAKRGRKRRILVPSGVLAHLQAYIKTDRAALMSHLGGRSRPSQQSRFIVRSWEPGDSKLVGEIDGVQRTFDIKRMSAELRSRTYQETERGLESLAVFVNSWGRMTSKATWHRVFNNASALVASHPGSLPAAAAVHPHTLRHTFARRYLAFLRRASRRPEYVDDWGSTDEVVIVQRALGHASLATTSKYVSGDPVSGAVAELFYQSTNTDEDFGEMIDRFLLERADA